MKQLLIIVMAALILAGAWFFVSPLFIDRTVDEDFDFTLEGGGVDMDAVMSMSDEKRQSLMDDIMAEAAGAPDRPAADAMPEAAPAVVAVGNFVDADPIHKGTGNATLYALPDARHLLRFEEFRTTNGPALVVYLAKHPAPTRAADVVDGGFLSLGKLKGNVGNQNYEIPADINIADYNSVVIWCELFGVLFSPASLVRPPAQAATQRGPEPVSLAVATH